ncbi:hypothetical protein EJ02DRAFT_304638, partial [Clathrospora elynae]
GRDRNTFENESANFSTEEQFMEEWRKYGPIGVLFDFIASIFTPQTQQFLEQYQRNDAVAVGLVATADKAEVKQLVRPVK